MKASLAVPMAFLASLAVHGAVMAAFLMGFLAMNDVRDPRLPVLAIAWLLLIALAGFGARRRWAHRWQGPIALGVIVAAAAMTGVVLWLSWALSYPVMEPPPFADWLATILRERNAGLWIMGPVVMSSLASALGYALGGLRARTRG